jgi:hypothetical protein
MLVRAKKKECDQLDSVARWEVSTRQCTVMVRVLFGGRLRNWCKQYRRPGLVSLNATNELYIGSALETDNAHLYDGDFGATPA